MGFEIYNGRLEKYSEELEVTNIEIPNGVEVIGESAFANCRKLESIILNEGVKSIEYDAFKYCIKLKRLVIPNSVKANRFDRVVSNCWELEELILSEQITVNAGEYWYDGGMLSFDGCNKLECLVCPGIKLEHIMKTETAALTGFIKYSDMFNISEVRKSYEDYILKYKKRMYPIILKYDAVNVLKLYAEAGKIKKSNFEEFMDQALEEKATACVAYLLQWKQEQGGANKTGTKITEKEQKKVVKKKDPEEARLNRLWKYRVEDDNTITILEYKSDETEIVIPSKIGELPVITIGSSAFEGYGRGHRSKRASLNSQIKTIELQLGIKKIWTLAFKDCHELNTIIIPESVIEIDQNVFANCISLKYIKIPSSIKKIKQFTFFKCESLLDVYITSKETVIEEYAFEGCPNKMTLHASEGSYAEAYAKEHKIPFVAE